MFDALSNRLQDVFQSLKGETRLTEATVERVLGEIRLALLEADVNFKVVKAFVDRVRDRAMDVEVQKGLNPSQQVIKIVRDELLALFGDAKGGLQETIGPAARDFDARAAGLGQDHDHRQAREVAREAGAPPDRRVDRRAAPGGDPAAGDRGAAGRRAGARPGRRNGSGRARQGRAGRGQGRRQRRRHRRHRGPAAHRRRADEGARRDQGSCRDRRICSTSPTR